MNAPNETVTKALQATLVEFIDLALVGKQAHWSVVGPQFRSIHLELDEIVDLARDLIHLSGLPKHTIDIVFTGTRPGEKLYEELLLGANTTGTEHPRILRSGEPFLPADELWKELDALNAAMKRRDQETIQSILTETVEGYRNGLPEEEEGEDKEMPVFAPLSGTLH